MGLLSSEERNDLIALLLKLPNRNNPVMRRQLYTGLPRELQDQIVDDGAPRTHITSIVNTVDDESWDKPYEGSWPVLQLIENAIHMSGRESLIGHQLNLMLISLRGRASASFNYPNNIPAHDQTSFELKLPDMGKPFLSKTDREWIINTVDTVIGPMSTDGIKNLLRGKLPDSSINRINFRDGSRNIAETIVGMLELRGVLNPPEYHALGAFLTDIPEVDLVGYDAAVKIVALLFRYNLVKSRIQITELSAHFQVPSPVLSIQTYPGQSPSLPHLPVKLNTTDIHERLENLYNHGIRYMLDVNFLISGARVASSVCRVEFDKRGEGTGFLVAPDLILTNYHVMLPSGYRGDPILRAQKCGVRFGAIKEKDGGVGAGRYFKLHDKWLVAQSEPNDLDFMLIRLQRPVTAEDQIAPLPLEPITVQKEDFVNIIQHPNGGPMEVSLRFNQVVIVEDKRVYYLADTEKGSSGSPVFDDEWKVVALHHSGGELDAAGRLIVEANAGISIDAIREKIDSHLQS